MNFSAPLLPGRLVRRYQRFLADIVLDDGRAITAHTPNTGSLLGCTRPGSRVWVSEDRKPGRRLPYTWEIATDGEVLVGVHTGRANLLAREGIESGLLAELAGAATIRPEVRYGADSRIDLLLEGPGVPPCYVEVKNVTLGRAGLALFPDAVTERGAKHLRALAQVQAAGARAAMLFVVQREDCQAFAPADDIDPHYGALLREVRRAGVMVLAYRARVSPQRLRLDRPLPLAF